MMRSLRWLVTMHHRYKFNTAPFGDGKLLGRVLQNDDQTTQTSDGNRCNGYADYGVDAAPGEGGSKENFASNLMIAQLNVQ